MLCKRVICLLTLSHGQLVRTKRFKVDRWYSLESFSFKGADEVVVVDVSRDRKKTEATIARLISEAFVPVTLGGGLRTLEDAKWAFGAGADKVLSSSGEFCREVSDFYGRQACVLGWTDGLKNFPELCHGETLFQSVERDGSLLGYESPACWPEFEVPIVVGSGCGNWSHMEEAFKAGADGCATSNVLHFSESALSSCKQFLKTHGIKVRP